MLGINDELLSLAGRHASHDQLIVGLPAWMDTQTLTAIFNRCKVTAPDQKVVFKCERADVLLKDLNARSIDVVYSCNAAETPLTAITRWIEQLYWAKSPDLKLNLSAPIPLVRWPGTHPDRVATAILQKYNVQFCLGFSGPEWSARRTAVLSGLGICATLARMITPEMEIIRNVPPALPAFESGLFARDGLDLRRFGPLVRALVEELEPPTVLEGGAIASDFGKVRELRPSLRLRRAR